MTTIENDQLKVSVSNRGAELTSIYHKANNLEYLWQASPLFWGKHSPVLFPIVGTLKGNQYFFQGRQFTLGRHGFARERLFDLSAFGPDFAEFHLQSDELSRQAFPFNFDFKIRYVLLGASISVTYKVYNPSDFSLYFSIGAHPAFNVPLDGNLAYSDYYLEFGESETAPKWPITPDGLIAKTPEPFLQDTRELAITHELFAKDALVFKGLRSECISIKSRKNPRGIHFRFKDFPFLGLWAAPNADFVCIEPWCGIADSEDANQQLEDKEGIIRLDGKTHFSRSWSVELF